MSDQRHTAVHEAGHAVMACRLGIEVQSITLVPQVVDGIRRNGGTHLRGAIVSKQDAIDTALCFLAAFPACVAAGVDGWLGRQDDMDGALSVLSKWVENAEVAYDECEARANAMMGESKNKAAVERLASLLLERRSLDGDAVLACIAQSDADLER